MKRSARATVRRTLRRAVSWRPKSPGSEAVSISALISPLRYDVRVRADFFDLVATHDGHLSDEQLCALAWESPYGEWFRSVAMPRFRPWVLDDPRLTRATFAQRVATARALWDSFQSRGFDPRMPVTLRSIPSVTVTESGIRIAPRLHVGDGGHRLALLLHYGLDLSPPMYRVEPRTMPPIDNTAVLLARLGLSTSDYVRFLSPGYTDAVCADLDQLRFVVSRDQPQLLDELDSVMAAHVPLMGNRHAS